MTSNRANDDRMQADRRIEPLTIMYRRAVAGWASSLLATGPLALWRDAGKPIKIRDHSWRWLYAGSILDD